MVGLTLASAAEAACDYSGATVLGLRRGFLVHEKPWQSMEPRSLLSKQRLTVCCHCRTKQMVPHSYRTRESQHGCWTTPFAIEPLA